MNFFQMSKNSTKKKCFFSTNFFNIRIQQHISSPSLKRKFIGNYSLKPQDHTINVLQWNILAQGIGFFIK